MKNREHLPVYGVGPVCVYLMVGLVIAGFLLEYFGFLASGHISFAVLPMRILGGVLITLGVYLWIQAVIVGKISREIVENHLVTTGVYAWVRNPIYSGIALALTGIVLMAANVWLLVLPVLFWLDITLMMKFTEEKWLLEYYGEDYRQYCRRVNRCIPWFPKE